MRGETSADTLILVVRGEATSEEYIDHLIESVNARLAATRPATRVGNVVIFPGGTSRQLTRRERLRLFLRRPVVLDAASGLPTRPIGREV